MLTFVGPSLRWSDRTGGCGLAAVGIATLEMASGCALNWAFISLHWLAIVKGRRQDFSVSYD